jgi:hypothetical protein
MANKHKAREPGTKLVVWARSELGMNKRVGLRQETRHDPCTSMPIKPAFLH